MPKLIALLMLLFARLSFAQTAFNAIVLQPAKVPTAVKFNGKISEAWSWTDKLGENILVLSSLASLSHPDKHLNSTTKTIELYSIHYVKSDSGFHVRWRLTDQVEECELDLLAAFFINGTPRVTDLDEDGIAETTIQYKLVCRSDVSPAYMKLIMHEDSTKYALRGSMWIRDEAASKFTVTDKDVNLEKQKPHKDAYTWTYGRYESEKDFIKAPPAFLLYARRQWLKFAKESE